MLTCDWIRSAVLKNQIRIEPFIPAHLNPNSYDVRLSRNLIRFPRRMSLDVAMPPATHGVEDGCVHHEVIPRQGYVLQPDEAYLAVTKEYVASDRFIIGYEGRSTMARYFIQSHSTAGFIDLGFRGHITLEITCKFPTRIYPEMRIGQIYFFDLPETHESPRLYKGNYGSERRLVDPAPEMPKANNL